MYSKILFWFKKKSDWRSPVVVLIYVHKLFDSPPFKGLEVKCSTA